MKQFRLMGMAAVVALSSSAPGAKFAADDVKYWPQWRGPQFNGVAPHGAPPLEWSEEKNVAWKVEIPGRGSGTPVIWGDRLYLTTAVRTGSPPTGQETSPGRRGLFRRGASPAEHRFLVLAIDRRSGRTVWEKEVRREIPHEGTHPFGNFASGSAITDGEHVWAFFGSRGLYCLDKDGQLKWEKDFGDMRIHMSFGEGASPVLYKETLMVPWDHNQDSFLVALDKSTGRQRWKAARDEITSWATPLVVELEGAAQVVTNATNRIRSYDLASGELIWEARGMTRNPIPSPVAGEGIVYLMSGYRGASLLAIRLSQAQGDVTDSDAVIWRLNRDTPYTPSPLLYGDKLYFLKVNSNILSILDAKMGERHFQQRLPGLGDIFSSPVGASGRVYITDREGHTLVIRNGPQFEVLASNTLDDRFDASMAIVDKEIYLRGSRYLYRISEE